MMYQFIKRFFDFFFSMIGLILISPLFLILMVLLKLTGEGEIFYFQNRIGKNQKPFDIWKFATMLKDSPNIGNKTVTLRNDPRITPMGSFLRKSKINELPQIINVVIGDMSLVGPRPLLLSSFRKYTEDVQQVIYKNRPGITGLGSLIFRDEEKLVSEVKKLGGEPMDYYRAHIYPYKGQLEKWYYHNVSFRVDFVILFLTFWQIVMPQSQLVFSLLKDLPKRPNTLTVNGIHQLYKSIAQ